MDWNVAIPLLIFFARIIDVTLGTLRIVLVSRGGKHLAAVLGFFEVFIWIVVVSQIIKSHPSIINYIAYAGGFGVGNWVGLTLERRLSLGNALVRMVTHQDAEELVESLRSNNYGITCIDAEGAQGRVKVIFTVVRRKKIRQVLDILRRYNPRAFYTVEDIRYVNENNLFPYENSSKNGRRRLSSLLGHKK